MSTSMLIGILVYVLLFFASVFYNIKFHFVKESRDERGKKILHTSYAFSYLIIIFGWLIITLADEYIKPFSLESYKMAIFFLLTGTNIIISIILFNLKRTS
ncbi:hypothetical protein [Oceanobacillus kapialis]|uniref:DUF3784 domain-containing protein n=1 Tax=Oceanobacillus kapialis TaxID=481353 RepID=A0ABW5PWQ6_9BACI